LKHYRKAARDVGVRFGVGDRTGVHKTKVAAA
jgi:hypothetical protein